MANIDDIDVAIRNREAQVEELRHRLEIAEAELRGMKLVRAEFGKAAEQDRASTQPSRPRVSASGRKSARAIGYTGGRQPGAISQPWRRILSELYWRNSEFGVGGAHFPIGAVVDAAARHGIRLRPSEAEARLTHYIQFQYVVAENNGRFSVTDVAAQKFGFDKEPLKNEAPNAEASGPQESLVAGDQTGAD